MADSRNNRVQVFDNNGSYLRQWGQFGHQPGEFEVLSDIEIDGSDNVYVLSGGIGRLQIFDTTGTYIREFDNTGMDTGFWYSRGFALDSAGNVYIYDKDANRIQAFQNDGTFLYGWLSVNWGKGQVAHPTNVSVNSEGNLFVSDFYTHRIQIFDNNSTFVGQVGSVKGDGQYRFDSPQGVAFDKAGNFYLVDYRNHNIKVYDKNRVFLRQFGSYGSGDGELMNPLDIAFDSLENLYVADYGNSRIEVFDKNGNFIKHLATFDYKGGKTLAIDIDANDIIYLINTKNYHVIRYDTDGNRLEDWGTGLFHYPVDLTVDGHGNLYVLDNTDRNVRVFDSTGALIGEWMIQTQENGYAVCLSIASNPNGTLIYVGEGSLIGVQVFEGHGSPLP